jgi:hypothetical protein
MRGDLDCGLQRVGRNRYGGPVRERGVVRGGTSRLAVRGDT